MNTHGSDEELVAPVAIAMWVDEHDEPLPVAPVGGDPDPSEALAQLGHWVADRLDAAGDLKAAPGPRLGPGQERTSRSGSTEEVCAPLLVRPHIAMRALLEADVFGQGLRTIDVDGSSLDSNGVSCSWLASVRTGLFRSRDATLRIGPSPSGNITVLQLMPQHTRRFYTRSFVRAGITAVDEVGGRLARICSISRRGARGRPLP